MSKCNRGNRQEFEASSAIFWDRSSAHFRAFSSDNSNGLVANENLSTTHILGCADVICSLGRGRKPSRRRQNWRVENDKAARSVGGSHSLRTPTSTTTGADRGGP